MFYQFDQNNSGGSFDAGGDLCHRLFIEADNKDDAVSVAESLGCYWNGVSEGIDCSCCGDRWSQPWNDEGYEYPYSWSDNIVFNTVEEHAQYLANEYGWTTPDARIFYKGGRVVAIFREEEDV